MGALIFTGFLETKIYLLFNIQFSVMLCQSGHFGKTMFSLGLRKVLKVMLLFIIFLSHVQRKFTNYLLNGKLKFFSACLNQLFFQDQPELYSFFLISFFLLRLFEAFKFLLANMSLVF
jgi:hypothetical protein